ncbi:MAG TPA: hypothetical protein VGM01_01905 [Ktedonobacteraceae bacterium]
MPFSPLPQAVNIFFSYAVASPTDKNMFDELMKHLSILRRQHLIEQWYDSAISAGSNITQTIKAHLQEAQIIVLLLSAEFIEAMSGLRVSISEYLLTEGQGALVKLLCLLEISMCFGESAQAIEWMEHSWMPGRLRAGIDR